MRRRDFLRLAGAAATVTAWPLAGHAQQAGRLPRIEVVSLTYPDDRLKVLSQALADAGFVDGKTATIEFLAAPTVADTDAMVDRALPAIAALARQPAL